ncbi:anti-sigma factor [Demequina pelophila]|uniref:anti-sigma factor n=1 Tax=Demequina pelophila TaxID=1638984 RepID=UPI000780D5CA|nr:anti-sigma factor [Demequina pelophila]
MTDNVHGLLGPYAVDAVTPAERAAFEAHLPTCEECRLELASLLETAAVLGEAEAATPPPSLRGRVLDEVARTAQVPPSIENGTGASSLDTVAEARTRRRWPRLALAAAGALVLALGGVVGGSILADRNAELALEKEAMMVASAPDAHSMDLDLGRSHLVMSDRMASAVVMGDDCPYPKDGMEYQLWLVMDDGTKMAGPTFMPDDDGAYMTLVDTDMDGLAAIAVTVEPRGGSEQPTSDEVAVVEL